MSAAVENLLLEADALGLGAVWMGISPDQGRMEAVAKVLNLPEELAAFALVPWVSGRGKTAGRSP